MKPFEFIKINTISEACSVLSRQDRCKLIAGGTDLIINMKEERESVDLLIDLKTFPELDQIFIKDNQIYVGATTSLAKLEHHPLIREHASILSDTAEQMANPAIRNMATIGGNLCNAAPSADMAPPLLVLQAILDSSGPSGERSLPVEEFFSGPGEHVLRAGEILTWIHFPIPSRQTHCNYLKMTARTKLGIALVGVALALTREGPRIREARMALGAVAPTPIRAFRAEEMLREKPIEDQLLEQAATEAMKEAKPISDIRGSARYRSEIIRVLALRGLRSAMNTMDEK